MPANSEYSHPQKGFGEVLQMSEMKQNKTPRDKRSTELEWIDLEEDTTKENTSEKHIIKEEMPQEDAAKKDRPDRKKPEANRAYGKHPAQKKTGKRPAKKKKAAVNFHAILLCLIALIFVVIAFKLLFWDKRQRQNTERENDTTLSFDTEPLDSIVPLDSSNPGQKEVDNDLRILFVGNGPLADDKTSDTNLANIVREKTGATVYNCAIPGSYLSMKNQTYTASYPYDAFSFYFLCTLFTFGNTDTVSWAERDMGGLPTEVKESIDRLQSIDYSELDVLCIYYDAADYRAQRTVIDTNNDSDPTTFCGALHSGIALIKEFYPHIRIIVMSPSYAYAVDESGNLSSSFEKDVLPENLAYYIGMESYVCIQDNVSFVDNFYGSIYEEIADKYLEDDGILLNKKGHALLADRFMDALNKFHDYNF